MTIPRSSIIDQLVFAVLTAAIVSTAGCSSRGQLTRPQTLTARHTAVYAVGPMFNESGTTISADDLASVSDKLVASMNAVGGWSAVPFNRTLQAMKQLGLTSIQTDEEARTLCAVIGVDGILVGTVTAWNPYDPPRFGANLLLVPASPVRAVELDPSVLYGRTGDQERIGAALPASSSEPLAITLDLDAVNHTTRGKLRRYARSRLDVTGGFDPPERYYLMIYDRWLEFAAEMAVRDLVILDDIRTARIDEPAS